MFHKMINTARDRWYNSEQCTIGSIVDYIISNGHMRDAQVEAIKTYLYLKVGCENKPLSALFIQGKFNNINLNEVALTSTAKSFLESNPAAAALLEYSRLTNSSQQQVSASLEAQITQSPDSIDYEKVFIDAFYGVSYTDYLFSLPMGAGKTFLMAAFIYLDLYFTNNEPDNNAFARNFIIFAPSGLKSSVVPSLRTIQRFDPSWILPEPTATNIKRIIKFEVLDQEESAKKSNKVKNPNVQKIAGHQPFSEIIGLVAITNAEKVILDRITEQDGSISFFEESLDDKDRAANELRNLIGKLPGLSVFIDEVHHAVSDEIKLRAVVNKWSESNTINSVIGFSGTPYIERAERIVINDTLSVASSEISNIVYYYPLVSGIGNFLKKPIVKISDVADSTQIVEDGTREFFSNFKNTIYDGGLTAKLGIYCGTIEKLENIIYPLVLRIADEYGLGQETILRFHKGNKEHPQPVDSQLAFDILDTPMSKIRIVLLVQIGKEGWDCRSLTGIILSQEGDCPRNMVLQTSCRCLRQVVKDIPESALIYLNNSNGDKLVTQLRQQHHITLREFTDANSTLITMSRYDRREYLKLPPIHFYQLSINYDTLITEEANPHSGISDALQDAEITATSVTTQDFSLIVSERAVDYEERGSVRALYLPWLYNISKSSFGFIALEQLLEHEDTLRKIFDSITYIRNGNQYFSSKYNLKLIESNIRQAFCDKRSISTKEELIPRYAILLNISSFSQEIYTDTPTNYYPEQTVVKNIILSDTGKYEMRKEDVELIEMAEKAGRPEMADAVRQNYITHPAKDRSFHYIPYKTDSGFEETFLKEVLTFPELKDMGLEVYYNGDRHLTDFKIRCYKGTDGNWSYIGKYTPDFLIISRNNGEIYKAIIIETKGKIFAGDLTFKDKRRFVETHFKDKNNDVFGYERFEYLYLEDSMPENEWIAKTSVKIREFFAQ